MQIQINGKQVETGEALRTHVSEKLAALADKYAERAVDAAVTISREGHAFKADAKMHLPTGLVAQASGSANEVYAAFEAAAERLEKQLRRYKRRLTDRHADRKGAAADEALEPISATSYVLQAENDDGGAAAGDEPVIIAETTMSIDAIDVGEAVARMELSDASFLMFRSRRHGGINVVFRRDDGHIGWIDPEILAARQG